MTRAIKAGLVAFSGAVLAMACAMPAWSQARGGASRAGGFSHGGGGFSRAPASGFSRAPMGGVGRAPMARIASRVAPRPLARTAARNRALAGTLRGRTLSQPRTGGVHSAHDHFGRHRRVGVVVFLTPGYPGYTYYPFDLDTGFGYDDTSYDTYASSGASEQPQETETPQPAPTVVIQQPPAPSQSAAVAPQAYAPDAGQFILLRKDGQVVLTSAFTVSADRVSYITPQGARRAFPASELDKEATRQINDAAGTPVALSD